MEILNIYKPVKKIIVPFLAVGTMLFLFSNSSCNGDVSENYSTANPCSIDYFGIFPSWIHNRVNDYNNGVGLSGEPKVAILKVEQYELNFNGYPEYQYLFKGEGTNFIGDYFFVYDCYGNLINEGQIENDVISYGAIYVKDIQL